MGSHTTTTARAIVARPSIDGVLNWKMETVTLPPLGEHDLLVRMVSSGICSTDIFTSMGLAEGRDSPMVLGHEGAGYVTEVGSGVTVAKVGDPVLLSFASCSTCKPCQTSHPAYCLSWRPLNMPGVESMFQGDDSTQYTGKYFGQSSFASSTVVMESSVVNVAGLISSDDELKMLAPMGCGFQTGSGAVTAVARAGPSDSVVVLGVGGVGCAAIMAAKISGCQTIIGVDIQEGKLETARAVGATHCFNTSDPDLNLVSEIVKITGGVGASLVIETTGNLQVMETGVQCTDSGGQIILIGLPAPTAELNLNVLSTILHGKQIRGCIEGDIVPAKYLPIMIQWLHEKRYPIEKVITYYSAEDHQQAVRDMKKGSTIKPVLVW